MFLRQNDYVLVSLTNYFFLCTSPVYISAKFYCLPILEIARPQQFLTYGGTDGWAHEQSDPNQYAPVNVFKIGDKNHPGHTVDQITPFSKHFNTELNDLFEKT